MKIKDASLTLLLSFTLPLMAQAPAIISMADEPHHHLALHNDYVNVYNAEAAAGESLLLHRHNNDAVAIAISDQMVTVSVPGKPDVHQKNPDGQVRLQPSGYVHSTHVDGQAAYHTIAIELLQPQTGERNLCATVLAAKPTNCPDGAAGAAASKHVPLFESNQTRIQTVRLPPHQNVKIATPTQSELLVALDQASISPSSGNGADELLRPGEFLWFDKGAPTRSFKNGSNKEVRFVELTFKPAASAKSAADTTKPTR